MEESLADCVGLHEIRGFLTSPLARRMKKADDGNVFVVKTMKIIDEDSVNMIREKQEKLRAARAERRHKE